MVAVVKENAEYEFIREGNLVKVRTQEAIDFVISRAANFWLAPTNLTKFISKVANIETNQTKHSERECRL